MQTRHSQEKTELDCLFQTFECNVYRKYVVRKIFTLAGAKKVYSMYFLERELKQVSKERKWIYKRTQFQRGLRGDYYSEVPITKATKTDSYYCEQL